MASSLDLLTALRILALQRQGDGSLRPLGAMPAAFTKRFPALRDETPQEIAGPTDSQTADVHSHENPRSDPAHLKHIDFEQVFGLLTSFLADAERFWQRGDASTLRSGPWTQPDGDGRPTVLAATALLAGPQREPFLLIELLGAEFAEQQEVLQHSREQRLQFENLTRMHEALAESSRSIERLAAERESAIALLREAREQLEDRVAKRTVELQVANDQLAHESIEREHVNRSLRVHQDQLGQLAKQLAATEERERREIAEFLHDRIGQNLALVKLRLRALAKTQPTSEPSLQPVEQLMDEIISDTRSLTADLGTPLLYELGLVEALQSLVRRFEEVHGIATRFEDDERDKPLDETTRLVLYQAVRELLHNIVKHAETKLVVVRVQRNGPTIRVQVIDHGTGFDSSSFEFRVTTTGGFGLFNIRERLQHLGGSCAMQSTKGAGTEVTLTVPLARSDRGAPPAPKS